MSSKTRIRIRRGTTEEWAEANPLLLLGELGLDTSIRRLKAGDGDKRWNQLPYIGASSDNQALSGLEDVAAYAAVDGSVLVYNAATGVWEAGPATAIPEVLNGGNF